MAKWRIFQTAAAIFAAAISSACAQQSWDQSATLDPNRRIHLSWSADKSASSITFNLTAMTNGWVGLGFNSKGSMVGADIVVGWVKEGQTYFKDRHATGNALPLVDESQDYELLESSEVGNLTTLIFTRKIDTCDPDDFFIEAGTTSVLYAFGEEDPEGDDPTYHEGNKGVQSLMLLDPPPGNFSDDDTVKSFELRMPSVLIPHEQDTTYWCNVFRGPSLETKHQYIGNEAIVAEGSENHFHHFNLYECIVREANDEEAFEQLLQDYPKGFECFDPEAPTPIVYNNCAAIRIAWATGGRGDTYPPEAGYPIPTADQGRIYYYIEVHYDNQELAEGIVDTSGVRMYYTDQLRPYDVGLMLVSMPVSYTQLVPPGAQEFVSVGHAAPYCTEKYIPEDGINVFAIMHHSHLAGRKMRTRLIRDGVELPWLLNDNHYDFSYQQTRLLTEQRKVYPGDQLTTECYLDTMERTEPTLGGWRTTDEMCESFLLYYPAMDLFSAESYPSNEYIDGLFGFYNVTFDRQSLDYMVGDIPMKEYMKDFDWTTFDSEAYQRNVRFGVHEGTCITSSFDFETGFSVSYPENLIEYEEPPRECPGP